MSVERERINGDSLRDKMDKVESLVELKDILTSDENRGELIPEDLELINNPPEGSLKDMKKDVLREYIDKFKDEDLRNTIDRLVGAAGKE